VVNSKFLLGNCDCKDFSKLSTVRNLFMPGHLCRMMYYAATHNGHLSNPAFGVVGELTLDESRGHLGRKRTYFQDSR
jgi:hypothetical protein